MVPEKELPLWLLLGQSGALRPDNGWVSLPDDWWHCSVDRGSVDRIQLICPAPSDADDSNQCHLMVDCYAVFHIENDNLALLFFGMLCLVLVSGVLGILFQVLTQRSIRMRFYRSHCHPILPTTVVAAADAALSYGSSSSSRGRRDVHRRSSDSGREEEGGGRRSGGGNSR